MSGQHGRHARQEEERAVSRRVFLRRSSELSFAAAVTITAGGALLNASEAWALDVKGLEPQTMKTLILIARDIYPHDKVPDRRSIRLNGQSTSIRLERMFWNILEQIAARENMSVPSFISTLHSEVLLMWGPVPNFTSHLRCICLVALQQRSTELPAAPRPVHRAERQHHVVVG